MRPVPEQLDELTRRIVDAVHPLRIILFGSAARDEMRRESDLDIAVVVPDGLDRRDVAEILYPRLFGLGIAVDLLIVTPGLLEKYKASRTLIYYDIGRDGKELYAA
jgi:predicted nucleotidyltransferase